MLQGKEHLSAFKLTEESATLNIMSKCCHTIMLVDHPFYEGHVCAAYCGPYYQPCVTHHHVNHLHVQCT